MCSIRLACMILHSFLPVARANVTCQVENIHELAHTYILLARSVQCSGGDFSWNIFARVRKTEM